MAQSLTLAAGASVDARAAPAAPHVCLLGDSIFDNQSYVGRDPDVVAQLRGVLPAGWRASLLAVDGDTTAGVARQLRALPPDASHLVLSVGGNDALGNVRLLSAPARSVGEALATLSGVVGTFEAAYRAAVAACLGPGLPLVICTIYNGNFPDPAYRRQVTTALAVFNDAILRTAAAHRLTVIDLRRVCNRPQDYANPIEPSAAGGAKIAAAIARAVTAPPLTLRGAHVVDL